MKSMIGFRTLKTGMGAMAAMILAEVMKLQFSASAGIITILSIQNTKRESCEIAARRILATIMALAVGGGLFEILGFNPVVFGIYIILFIPLAVKFKVTEGIVPASVLVTHLLGCGEVTIGLVINELLLMLVGAGVALLLNIYMPSIESELLQDKRHIEEAMYEILMDMSLALNGETLKKGEIHKMEELKGYLEIGRKRAHQHSNNYFINEMAHYEKYFEMRSGQFQVMEYMIQHFDKFSISMAQGRKVGELTRQLAESTKGKVTVEELMALLESLRLEFKASELPKEREEFENRAMLYQFLNDVELFITIKMNFKQALTEKEREQYQRYYDIY